MQPLPLNLEAEARGFNNLGWAGKYEPDWQFTTVNANGDWARKNPRIATGFVRALLRGQQFIWSNPDQAARIAANVLKTDVVLAERSLAEAIRLGILDRKLAGPSLACSASTRTCRPTAPSRPSVNSNWAGSPTPNTCAPRRVRPRANSCPGANAAARPRHRHNIWLASAGC
jgi:hypothetical protein